MKIKIKTNELSGIALDWAVAKCENADWSDEDAIVNVTTFDDYDGTICNYSTDWAQAGPIIEREKLDVCIHKPTHQWCSATQSSVGRFARGYGPTPLVAAMRAYVASKLGDVIDVPKELTK